MSYLLARITFLGACSKIDEEEDDEQHKEEGEEGAEVEEEEKEEEKEEIGIRGLEDGPGGCTLLKLFEKESEKNPFFKDEAEVGELRN